VTEQDVGADVVGELREVDDLVLVDRPAAYEHLAPLVEA
jgi:hypothetical protein